MTKAPKAKQMLLISQESDKINQNEILIIRILNLELVSDFDIRISELPAFVLGVKAS